jgi:hypothetical protein
MTTEIKKPRKSKKIAAENVAAAEVAAPVDALTPEVTTVEAVAAVEVAPAAEPTPMPDPWKLFDEVPYGGADKKIPVLATAINDENREYVLRELMNAVLAVTGPRDGMSSSLDRRAFHAGVRTYIPEGHYKRAPLQAVKPLDEEIYVARVGSRILDTINEKKLPLSGGLNSHENAQVRIGALYEALVSVAASKGLIFAAQ